MFKLHRTVQQLINHKLLASVPRFLVQHILIYIVGLLIHVQNKIISLVSQQQHDATLIMVVQAELGPA